MPAKPESPKPRVLVVNGNCAARLKTIKMELTAHVFKPKEVYLTPFGMRVIETLDTQFIYGRDYKAKADNPFTTGIDYATQQVAAGAWILSTTL